MSKVTSIRLSDELASQLDQLAASLDRSRSWLIEQAIARYVDEEAWQVAAIKEALTEYQEGRTTHRSHDEVMADIKAKIEARMKDAGPLG
jgi:predicted transcriptional regulator